MNRLTLIALLALGGCVPAPAISPEEVTKGDAVCRAAGMDTRIIYSGLSSKVVGVTCEPRPPCPTYCLPDSALKGSPQ